MRARLAAVISQRGEEAERVKQFSPVPVVRLSFTPSERASESEGRGGRRRDPSDGALHYNKRKWRAEIEIYSSRRKRFAPNQKILTPRGEKVHVWGAKPFASGKDNDLPSLFRL